MKLPDDRIAVAYGVDQMKIGDVKEIPRDHPLMPVFFEGQGAVTHSVRAFGRKRQRKFRFFATPDTITVVRYK